VWGLQKFYTLSKATTKSLPRLSNNSIDMSSTFGTDTEDEPVPKRSSSEDLSRKATMAKSKTKSLTAEVSEIQMMQ